MIVPTKTTNITGLRTWVRGSSFLNDSIRDWRRMALSKRLRLLATPCGVWSIGASETVVITRTFRD